MDIWYSDEEFTFIVKTYLISPLFAVGRKMSATHYCSHCLVGDIQCTVAGTSGWTSQLCWCWRQDDINPFLNLLLFMVQRNYFQLYIGAPGSNFKRIQNMSMSERVSFHHYCEDSSDLAQFISDPVPFKIVVTDMTYVDIIYILKCSSTVPQSITMRLICS